MRLSRWCFQNNGRPLYSGGVSFFLRNAIAFGASPRQRFNLVLNNLAGFAFTAAKISRDEPTGHHTVYWSTSRMPIKAILGAKDVYKAILGAKYKPSPHSLEVPPISRLD